jgi:hypothetical protein
MAQIAHPRWRVQCVSIRRINRTCRDAFENPPRWLTLTDAVEKVDRESRWCWRLI